MTQSPPVVRLLRRWSDDRWQIVDLFSNIDHLGSAFVAALSTRGDPLCALGDAPRAVAWSLLQDGLQRQAPVIVLEDYPLQGAGGPLWIAHTLHVSYDTRGEPAEIEDFLVDVTARRQRGAALEIQAERLSLVLEGTRLGMWDWNPQTDEVVFDARWAEMLGYRLEEVPFQLESWRSRVHPDDLETCYADLRAHMSGERPFYENVHRMRHRDGRWIYILDRGRIMARDAAGHPTRFSGTHTDITDEKEAELRAHAAAHAKGQFLATMSHEIRTPLHGILGLIQALQQMSLSPEQRDLVRIIQQSGDSLLVLINDILDFSKLESGRLALSPHRFDLRGLLQDAVALFGERAREQHLTISLEIAPSVPACLLGDGHRLRQVVLNLLSNALKFTPSGGAIRIWAEATPCLTPSEPIGVTLRVQDTGIGIANPAGIWEHFQQADSDIARHFGGTGLGLSICREVTHLMGGSIAVESTPGVGTTFTVHVPLLPAPSLVPPAEAPSPASVPEGLRVLVVDDSLINQTILRYLLGTWSLEITTAGSGQTALEAIAAAPFDVVLMDLHMPEMSGLEATQGIRKLSQVQPRIIGLSADSSPETIARCLASGMDDFLGKPFSQEDLSRQLSASPQSRGLRRGAATLSSAL